MSTPAGVVTQVCKTGSHDFPQLTRQECIDITTRAFEQGRAKLIKDLDDAKVEPVARQAAIERWRALEGTYELLLNYCKSVDGGYDVLQRSIGKMNGNAPEIDKLGLAPNDFVILAGRLCGFVLEEPDQAEKRRAENMGYEEERNPR